MIKREVVFGDVTEDGKQTIYVRVNERWYGQIITNGKISWYLMDWKPCSPALTLELNSL